jgi:hypothetical protein
MSRRKMFQLAISLTLLIALLGGGMGVWAEASNQQEVPTPHEPTPEERDWEPTPWPYPPLGPTWTPSPLETPYDGQVYVPETTPEERDWEPTPWPYPPLGPTWTPSPLETPYDGQVYVPETTPEERDWEPTPFPAPPPIGTPYCDPLPVPQLGVGLDGARFTEILPWPEPVAPRGLPPAEPPDGAGVMTQPAGDVEIAAISSGVQRPYRSGLNAHGTAWTRAGHDPAVLTQVVVDVGLWRWDAIGARWVQVGAGFASASVPCWRGLITAEGLLAIAFNASTGQYVVTSLHRVYVNHLRVYSRNCQSETVWLTFP